MKNVLILIVFLWTVHGPLLAQPKSHMDASANSGQRVERVVVRVLMDAEGRPRNPVVVESSNVIFNDHAVRSVMGKKYKPHMENGVPTETVAFIPLSFNFDSSRIKRLNKIEELEAHLKREIEKLESRPRKTIVTPTSRDPVYALYFQGVQDILEKNALIYWPKDGEQKLYGKLIVYIPIFQDGSIYWGDGGPRVERSSDNAVLDERAIALIVQSAPFQHFDDEMKRSGRNEVVEIVTTFSFETH